MELSIQVFFTLQNIFVILQDYAYRFSYFLRWEYSLHCDKSLKYSVKKIFGFYINYWMAFWALMLLAFICGSRLSINSIILEAVGSENRLMKFCWYVPFYSLIRLVLPLYSKILRGKWYVDMVLTVLCYLVIRAFDMILADVQYLSLLDSMSIYFPVLSMAYLLVRYDTLGKLKDMVQERYHSRGAQIAIGLVFVFFTFGVNAVRPFLKGISTGAVLVPIYNIRIFADI